MVDQIFTNTVSIQNASKVFGSNVAVRQMTLVIPKGQIYGLIGPNGSGKTTTIRMIVGITEATSGNVLLFDTREPESVSDQIGYVPEINGLIKRLKVIEYVCFVAQLHGLSKREAIRRGDALLDRFNIADTRDQPCSAMSKGMAQKVQVITAMIHEPALLILDEPFSGLDPVNMNLVRDAILDYKNDSRTILFSTHIMEHAEQICDSVVMINKGRVLLNATLEEIKSKHGDSVKIEFQGDPEIFQTMPEIKQASVRGNEVQVDLAENIDHTHFLRHLLEHVDIVRYDRGQMSLHDIFIRSVEADTDGMSIDQQQENLNNDG